MFTVVLLVRTKNYKRIGDHYSCIKILLQTGDQTRLQAGWTSDQKREPESRCGTGPSREQPEPQRKGLQRPLSSKTNLKQIECKRRFNLEHLSTLSEAKNVKDGTSNTGSTGRWRWPQVKSSKGLTMDGRRRTRTSTPTSHYFWNFFEKCKHFFDQSMYRILQTKFGHLCRKRWVTVLWLSHVS